jgi:octanoyl-[GcvH]:protein N-octanoyltransferase
VRLLYDSFPDRPAFDTAVSHALLLRVARGELEPTLRLHRPSAIVAFGKLDTIRPGYADAVAAARAHGFAAVERMAGGRAAVYHEQTLGLAEAIADPDPTTGTHDRFRAAAGLLAEALAALGVDARVGEVPGEYCPGEYSVNAAGRVKLIGTGQRIIRGGAHLGAVIVVQDPDRVRSVLRDVYAALDYDWDPATVGAIADEAPGTTLDDVERAVSAAFAARHELVAAELDAETLALAEQLEPRHVPPWPGSAERVGVGDGPLLERARRPV